MKPKISYEKDTYTNYMFWDFLSILRRENYKSVYHNNINRPSIIRFSEDGSIYFVNFVFYKNSHRTDGPAFINYKTNKKEYCINGNLLSNQDFFLYKIQNEK